jgi:hypothetical protein
MPNSTLIFAKRSLKLNKLPSGMGIVLASIGFLAFDVLPYYYVGALAAFVLIAVPFMVLGIFMFATPVNSLYIYDKNNGVLEYLISLGWNQGDIFKRYLKAALLIALIPFTIIFSLTMIVDVIVGAQANMLHDLAWLTLIAGFGFSVVSFVTIAMIAFSSLQRPVGGNTNSPLALSIGALIVLPTFYIQIASYSVAVLVDLSIPVLVGVLSIVLLILSSRLIRREKMLP